MSAAATWHSTPADSQAGKVGARGQQSALAVPSVPFGGMAARRDWFVHQGDHQAARGVEDVEGHPARQWRKKRGSREKGIPDEA